MGAAIQTTGNGQVVRGEKKPLTLQQQLIGMGPQIAKALPKHVSPDRMARIVMTALRNTPALGLCSPESFLGAVLSAAQLGLEVNTPLGHAYLVPYKQECQLILGYQGMMDLARRSGAVKSIYAHLVRKGDTFKVRLGLSQDIEHIPSEDVDRETQPITHVYAVAKLAEGDPVFVVLTKAQVEKYKNRSASKNSGPWKSDEEAMILKTAVRRLFTWLPKSAEMARAAAVDEALETSSRQSSAFDPTVRDVLEAEGVEVAQASHAPTEHVDEETGEVTPAAERTRQREPGED